MRPMFGILLIAALGTLPWSAVAAEHDITLASGPTLVEAVDPAGSEQLVRGLGFTIGAEYGGLYSSWHHGFELAASKAVLGAETHDHEADHLGFRVAYTHYRHLWSTSGGFGGVGPVLDANAGLRTFEPDGFSTWLFDTSIGLGVEHVQRLGVGTLEADLRLPLLHWYSKPPYSVESADTFRIGQDTSVLFDELAGFAFAHQVLSANLRVGYVLPATEWLGFGAHYRLAFQRETQARGVAIVENQVVLSATTSF